MARVVVCICVMVVVCGVVGGGDSNVRWRSYMLWVIGVVLW